MTSVPIPPGRIPAYDYRAPVERDVVAALQRVFGTERGPAEWADACRGAGLAPGGVQSTSALERALDALARLGAAQSAVARSIVIRMRTYDRLAARAATAGARP